MTLSKDVQDKLNSARLERAQLEKIIKEKDAQLESQLRNLVDEFQRLDTVVRHALRDLRQVKDLVIDATYFNDARRLLEVAEDITKDYR